MSRPGGMISWHLFLIYFLNSALSMWFFLLKFNEILRIHLFTGYWLIKMCLTPLEFFSFLLQSIDGFELPTLGFLTLLPKPQDLFLHGLHVILILSTSFSNSWTDSTLILLLTYFTLTLHITAKFAHPFDRFCNHEYDKKNDAQDKCYWKYP